MMNSWMFKSSGHSVGSKPFFESTLMSNSLRDSSDMEPWEPLSAYPTAKILNTSSVVHTNRTSGNNSYDMHSSGYPGQRTLQSLTTIDLGLQQHMRSNDRCTNKVQSLDNGFSLQSQESQENFNFDKKNNFLMAGNFVSQNPMLLSNLISCLNLDQTQSLNFWHNDFGVNENLNLQDSIDSFNNIPNFERNEDSQYSSPFSSTVSPQSSSSTSPKEHTGAYHFTIN